MKMIGGTCKPLAMRHFNYRILTLLAFAASVFSCQTQETEMPQPQEEKTILFKAGFLSTKTAFGTPSEGVYPTLWTDQDTQVKLSLNGASCQDVDIIPAPDRTSAQFSAVLDPSSAQAPYVFYALSPASASSGISESRSAWSVRIPAVQTPLEGSADESAQILSARSGSAQAFPDEVALTFSHVTAYGRISLSGLDLAGSEVKSVELTCTQPLAGEFYYGCADGKMTGKAPSSTLTLKTSRTSDLWFACAPAAVGGETLSVAVNTTGGRLVKEIQLPQGAAFTAGRIARFTVDMTGITYEQQTSAGFVLVKDASLLKDGDEVIILNAEETYALGTNQKKNNREAVSVSTVNHTLPSPSEDVQILTLEKNGADNTWFFNTGNGYLANKNGSSNILITIDSKTDNARFSIDIASDGIAQVKASSGARNIIMFNQNGYSPLFACYASGQKDIVLFRRDTGSGTVIEDPLTENEVFGAYLSADTRTYVAGEDQYSREYDGTALTFTLLNPAAKEQLEISGYDTSLRRGDEVTVTVSHRQGIKKIHQGVYRLQVVREDGSKVWLGNGSGEGFIIKK